MTARRKLNGSRKVGRPRALTPEIEEQLLIQVIQGSTITETCKRLRVSLSTVMKAQMEDVEFSQRFARAREQGVEANLAEAEDLLRHGTNKKIAVIRELAHHLRWKASKLKPRDYGDRVIAEIGGANGGPLAIAVGPVDWSRLLTRAQTPPGALTPAPESLPAPAEPDPKP